MSYRHFHNKIGNTRRGNTALPIQFRNVRVSPKRICIVRTFITRSSSTPAICPPIIQPFISVFDRPPLLPPPSFCISFLVYFFQFIRARFYPVARSSSSDSSLPSLRFLPAFDLSASLIRIYRGRIFSPTLSQGSNVFFHIGCSEISTLFASTKDLFS